MSDSAEHFMAVLSTDPSAVRALGEFVAEFIHDEIDDLKDLSPAIILDAFGCFGVPGSTSAMVAWVGDGES